MKENISFWGKILYVFDREQKLRAALLFFIIAIGAFVELVGVGAVLPFISAILTPGEILENPVLDFVYGALGFDSLNSFIIFLGLSIVAVYVIKNIYVYYMHSFQYRFTYDNQRILSLRMMKCYMSQPYMFHIEHNSAELMRNINEDVVSFFEAILAGLQLASEGGVCIALFIFLLAQDAAITFGVAAMGGAFGLLFYKFFRKRIKEAGRRSRNEQAATRQTLLEALSGIKEIIVLNRESSFTDKYDTGYLDYAEANRKFKVYSMIPKPVMETVVIGALLIMVCLKIYMGEDPASFVSTMTLFAMAAFRLLPSANRIAEYLSRIMFSKPAIDAIYRDLKEIEGLTPRGQTPGDRPLGTDPRGQTLWDSPPGTDPRGQPLGDRPFGTAPRGQTLGDRPLPFEKDIVLKNITFSYPGSERKIFDKADLVIPKRASVAFIGPSGGGKTTLADIILTLLNPVEGRVLIDGMDVAGNIQGYRKLLGYIPQTISLLDAAIRDNIVFGALADEERLQNAIKKAQLKDFIDSLPMGLDTMTGEGGVKLSGGQRQRIGIARALYNEPEVLVLDEATSALDNDTESAVMEAIDSLAGEKTLIIIAHRLSTIANCNVVYKIEDGKITKGDRPLRRDRPLGGTEP